MKNFFRTTSSGLLKLTLFSAAITASLVAVFASPISLKKSLADNKLYDGLVQNILESAKKNVEQGAQKSGDEPVSVDALEKVAGQAFTPEFLQTSTEQGIDGVYRWLNGEVAQPDFKIDLTAVKERFIIAAGAEVEKHVASLPVCNAQQLQTIDAETDALSLECRPPALSAAVARDNAITQLRSNEDFLKEPVLSAETLPKNENGKTFFEQAEGTQGLYQASKALPWILVVLSGLLAVAVLFLSETKRKGLKSNGITLLGTGLFLLVTGWLVGFLFDRAARPGGAFSKSIDNEFQGSILAVARSLSNIFNKTILMYCLIYILLGAAILVVLHFTLQKNETDGDNPKEDKKTENEPVDDKPEAKKPA